MALVAILVHGHLSYRLGKTVTNCIHLKQINEIEKRAFRNLNIRIPVLDKMVLGAMQDECGGGL
ncbi:hypothetical protein PSY31_23665, partial [Shigella flexneri]|nr:hypothetical protein [Shigella flexneri]